MRLAAHRVQDKPLIAWHGQIRLLNGLAGCPFARNARKVLESQLTVATDKPLRPDNRPKKGEELANAKRGVVAGPGRVQWEAEGT